MAQYIDRPGTWVGRRANQPPRNRCDCCENCVTTPEPEKQRLRELALSAPGPAPWFMPRTTPVDPNGKRLFRWRFSGTTGSANYLILLENQSTEIALYALAYVAWSLPAIDGYIVSYYRDSGFLTVEVHDIPALRAIGDIEIAKDEVQRKRHPVISASPPSRVERLADALAPGMHPAPRLEMCRDDEVLLLAAGPPGESAAASIYSWRAHEGAVEVFPQEWFNSSLDLGYQWITGVIRDPVSGRIVGHGIRLDPFELDATNTQVKRAL